MKQVARILMATFAASVWAILPGLPAQAVPPAITLSPSAGPPTGSVTVTGRGFGPAEVVDVVFDASAVGMATTNAEGKFSTTVAVPAEALPGGHEVTATGESSGLTASAPFTVRTDWPRLHFDAARTGFNPYENVLNTGNVSGLVQKWTASTFAGVAPSPAVWGGTVYVSPGDGTVRGLDPSTGEMIWSTDIGQTDGSAPDVSDGVVYVANDIGVLFALDAATGDALWNRRLGDLPAGPPAVDNGIVYQAVIINKEHAQGIRLYALDARNGSVRWKNGSASGNPALTVAGGLVYTTGWIGGVISSHDAVTGVFEWAQSDCGEICAVSSVSAANGLVYVDYEEQLQARSARSGLRVWVAAGAGVSYFDLVTIANGVVYLPNLDGRLKAWDAATGDLLWDVELPGGTEWSSPAVANGVLYVGSEDGHMRAFDAETGALLWESPDLGGRVRGAPAVSDGVVYVSTERGDVYAFGLP